ncbi:MAG: hypothetical protein AAGF31_02065 [Planctomycetota bacterium]
MSAMFLTAVQTPKLARIVAGSVIAAVCLLASSSTAEAGWPFNMPSNLRQQLNFGVGPGYHADVILVNPCKSKVIDTRFRYTSHPVKPQPNCYGFCGAMSSLPHESFSPAGPPVMPTHYSGPMHLPVHPVSAGVFPTAEPVFVRPSSPPAAGVSPPAATPVEPASPSDAAMPEQIPLPRG